ncbi:hypothetical protein ACH5RR_034283 [Cinchona calisaya]|uniref:RNA helicase n=1 Tax=Cinchona calisaya TaxID=153742 RepID=A0ABD2YDH0_9GENT
MFVSSSFMFVSFSSLYLTSNDRYVIDSGYVKQRQYYPSTCMYFLDVVQISKVQASQHAGRAGRTRPGKCYRLYPSMVYHDDFLDVTIPEIQRSSLAESVLYLKSLELPDIDIPKFDFLDPPSNLPDGSVWGDHFVFVSSGGFPEPEKGA